MKKITIIKKTIRRKPDITVEEIQWEIIIRESSSEKIVKKLDKTNFKNLLCYN